jgi:hypothetical protein
MEKLFSISSMASVDAYVSAGVVEIPPQVNRVLIHLKEENTNALKYKILASNEATYSASRVKTLKAGTVLAKDGSVYETCSDAWMWIDVQFCANVGSSQGALTVNISGAS